MSIDPAARIPGQDFNTWKSALSDLAALALTLWAEARGEDRQGREMVACVVLNRVAHAQAHRSSKGAPYWWGETPAAVCLKAWQFSCWNAGDPNRAKLKSVTAADPIYRVP